ncbi:MAG: hypothetical protein EPN93_21015 [Spirochaetes bacterium]|nr:MAG: hypothetical protein EPN93_21015 [Spirochaetota bacterium]
MIMSEASVAMIRRSYRRTILAGILFSLIVFITCSDEGGDGGPNAGDRKTFTIAHTALGWSMVYVPGGTFPTKADDSATGTVADACWIGETEVTWELWDAVRSMASSHGYAFQNSGMKGNDGAAGKTGLHPVSMVSWRDAMVFCNALTEWYNSYNETSYACAYTYTGLINRDSSDATACDNTVFDSSATGFRLVMKNEWELAARWRDDATNSVSGYDDPYFTRGSSASGATSIYSDAAATGLVAVYAANSGTSTAEVKSKTANSLGIYDMSGNVSEWCFDMFSTTITSRVIRGGSWSEVAQSVQVGMSVSLATGAANNHVSFRIAKKAP